MRPIQEIGAELGIQPEELIFYGHYKANFPKSWNSASRTGRKAN